MFSNTQIQILGTIREYEFAIAKGTYALANRIREANPDLVEEFNKADFEEFSKGNRRERQDEAIENAEQYGVQEEGDR